MFWIWLFFLYLIVEKTPKKFKKKEINGGLYELITDVCGGVQLTPHYLSAPVVARFTLRQEGCGCDRWPRYIKNEI